MFRNATRARPQCHSFFRRQALGWTDFFARIPPLLDGHLDSATAPGCPGLTHISFFQNASRVTGLLAGTRKAAAGPLKRKIGSP
jgi:hypothetical protein